MTTINPTVTNIIKELIKADVKFEKVTTYDETKSGRTYKGIGVTIDGKLIFDGLSKEIRNKEQVVNTLSSFTGVSYEVSTKKITRSKATKSQFKQDLTKEVFEFLLNGLNDYVGFEEYSDIWVSDVVAKFGKDAKSSLNWLAKRDIVMLYELEDKQYSVHFVDQMDTTKEALIAKFEKEVNK